MKLASIETIKYIKPHPNADKIEIAGVLGWQAIVPIKKFHVREKVVFIVIDTILPDTEWSKFLKDNNESKIRLKNAKLRGEYSQGLVLPLSVLPEEYRNKEEGFDVTSILGVEKYIKPIPLELAGDIAGPFPSHIIDQTDEDNGLSNLDLVEEVLSGPVDITIKLDGSSCSVITDSEGNNEYVCSRRLSLKESDTNGFWKVAKKIAKIETPSGLVIQGELVGPGIQKNRSKFTERHLRVFQIRHRHQSWLSYKEMSKIAEELNLECVPLYRMSWHTNLDTLKRELQSFDSSIEGIVVRPSDPTLISKGFRRPIGFKLINPNYND